MLLSGYGCEVTVVPRDGAVVTDAAKSQDFAVILMDTGMAQYDAAEVMEQVRRFSIPLFMVQVLPGEIEEYELCLGSADYVFIKPVNADVVIKRMMFFIGISANGSGHQSDERLLDLEILIMEMFRDIGLPAHIKGYRYMRDAIVMAVQNPDILGAITKELYPTIAEKNGTKAHAVERCMRHAIEVVWDRCSAEMLCDYFGVKNRKSTNSEFISAMANRIRMSRKLR